MTDAERRDLNREVARVVMGDDLTANTDDRIAEALVSFRPQSQGIDWLRPSYRLEIWNGRRGMSFQNEIEQHVRDWRAEPPDYAGDIREAMRVLERSEWAKIEIYQGSISSKSFCRIAIAGTAGDGYADKLPEAICRAALAALCQRSNSENVE